MKESRERSVIETDERSLEGGLWDAADVARFLSMSRSWVYRAVEADTLPCIRIGAAVRFDPSAIKAWLRGEKGGKVVRLPGCKP
jgi:excisionase family DNA binding protein